MSTVIEKRFTPQEYLALERQAEHKSEYLEGHIYAMTGASRRHNLIAGNVFGELRNQLKGRPCEVYVSDMRVKLSPTGLYTYPDVVALCGEARFEDEHVDTLLNPQVVFEVLFETTEAYDRGEKFAHYRRLDSLLEYVLIAQDRMRVEHYLRDGERWVLTEFSEPGGAVELPSIGCRLSLREVYDRVAFDAESGAAPPA